MKRSKGRSRPYRLSLLLVPLALLAALLVLPGPAYAAEARAPDTALTAPTAQSPPADTAPAADPQTAPAVTETNTVTTLQSPATAPATGQAADPVQTAVTGTAHAGTDPVVQETAATADQQDPAGQNQDETQTDPQDPSTGPAVEDPTDQPTDPDPQDPDQPAPDPDQPQPAEPAHPVALYLDGVRGNDAGDGSQDDPVKTFARAKELAQANTDVSVIYITGTVPIEGDVSLAGTSAIIIRAPDFPNYLMSVARGKTATLHDITLDGNHEHAAVVDESLVLCQGTLTIADGATLRNNWLTRDEYNTSHGGGVTVDGDNGSNTAHLFMTGGTISGNKAVLGGGVHVYWKAAFDMTGGAITGNTAYDGKDDDLASGGGVCVYGGSTFRLSGGDITNNTSDCYGGGISVGTSRFSVGRDRLYMTGANVSGNKSGACGGGIFIQAGTKQTSGWAQISAGSICNNVMTGQGQGNKSFGGGGIYVNGYAPKYARKGYHNGTLKLTNVVITDNTAAMAGGGIAACPVSVTKIYVSQGAAIYGNTAKGGKELYFLASNHMGNDHSGNPKYEISPFMFDGTPYLWKNQDGTDCPLNALSGTLKFGPDRSNAELSLHTDQTPASLAAGKVIISGNTSATRGGGIGSNGDVTIGQPPSGVL